MPPQVGYVLRLTGALASTRKHRSSRLILYGYYSPNTTLFKHTLTGKSRFRHQSAARKMPLVATYSEKGDQNVSEIAKALRRPPELGAELVKALNRRK